MKNQKHLSKQIKLGQALAKKEGRHPGRPKGARVKNEYQICEYLKEGKSIREIARLAAVSTTTVQKIKKLPPFISIGYSKLNQESEIQKVKEQFARDGELRLRDIQRKKEWDQEQIRRSEAQKEYEAKHQALLAREEAAKKLTERLNNLPEAQEYTLTQSLLNTAKEIWEETNGRCCRKSQEKKLFPFEYAEFKKAEKIFMKKFKEVEPSFFES